MLKNHFNKLMRSPLPRPMVSSFIWQLNISWVLMVNTEEYISEWPIYFNTWLGFLNSQENSVCVAHKGLVLFYYDMCRLHMYVI